MVWPAPNAVLDSLSICFVFLAMGFVVNPERTNLHFFSEIYMDVEEVLCTKCSMVHMFYSLCCFGIFSSMNYIFVCRLKTFQDHPTLYREIFLQTTLTKVHTHHNLLLFIEYLSL